jgi:hypothetical protein
MFKKVSRMFFYVAGVFVGGGMIQNALAKCIGSTGCAGLTDKVCATMVSCSFYDKATGKTVTQLMTSSQCNGVSGTEVVGGCVVSSS